MKSTVCWRNKFFSVGMTVFLMLLISACTPGNGPGPQAPAAAPGKYVYVNNDASTNYVSAFSINADGTLVQLAGSPYATGGAGYDGYYATNKIALAPVKRLLFASNAADSTIAVFSINQTDGTLTQVGAPVASGGTMSSGGSLAVDTNENYLFAGNFGEQSIAVFAISMGGVLSPVTGSPFNVGEQADGITMNPAGNILYAIRPSLAVLSMATDGSLSHITGSPFAINGTSLAFGSSTMLFSAEPGGVLSSYAIDASGAPTLLDTLTIGGNSQAVTTTRNGGLAILSGGGDSQISVLNVAADGTLTQVAGSPFVTAAVMYGYSVANPSGTFLYATETTQIEGFSIGADGALTSLGTFPLTNPGLARSLVIY